ncbi:MAG TPA: formate dehydrogenase subunit alpha [Rhodanobacteraceae bacterium]
MADAICTITLDGQALSGPPDQPLIDFLLAHGIDLPHVCYLRALGPVQTCDTCWVEVDGELKRACALRSADGMKIVSANGRAKQARDEGMNRILAKHELYCTLCENNTGDCQLHNTFAAMDIPIQRYPFERKPYDKDTSSPFYTYDPDQCILCGRCVEACQNVEVNETLSIDWSMDRPRVLWDGGKPIDESSCVHCGHCVTVCPCNALMEKTMQSTDAGPFTGLPESLKRPMIDMVKAWEDTVGTPPITGVSKMDMHWRQPEIKRTKTVCTYCGVGCSFEMWTRGRQLLKVQPMQEAPANGISTCIKGRFAWDFINSEERLTTPLIRENGRFREASWDEALDLVARRLLEIRDKHGPRSIGFIASSKASNEEAYLTQKIARLIIGTNSVDNSSRYCQSPATKGLQRTVGIGADSGTIRDIEKSEVVVLVGTNTAENHPVIASRIKRAHKLHGQKLIVFDLRKHEMAERADIFLHTKPSTDLVWASAFARYMFDHGLADMEFLNARVEKVDEYRASLEPFTMDFAAEITGLPKQQLIEAAEMIGNAKSVCLLWAMGITQHGHGADTSTALSNLMLVTGNFGKPGTGGYPMRGHNNVQGASDFGALKTVYPGYEKVTDEEARARWAKGWGVAPEQLSNEKGLDNFEMTEKAGDELKAMYIIGEETAVSESNAQETHKHFSKLDFMVVEDMFVGVTASFADVVLPACASIEKEGTFVNTERRIQRFYEVMPPLGDSRPDWRILTDLAARMGHDWGYTHPSQIMDECAGIAKVFAGVNYERLEGFKSLVWPVKQDGTDTPLLYTDKFHMPGGKAVLYPLKWQPPKETPDAEFDLHVNNGRLLEQFQSMNQTGKGWRVNSEVPCWFIEIGRDLAAERGIEDGAWLRVISRRGAVKVRALVTDRVHGNELYLPIHHEKPAMNKLTGDDHDPDVNTPAYKELAVRIEKLGETGASPLPRNNYRYGNPTPRKGVGVEQKWARKDYVPITEAAPHPEKM